MMQESERDDLPKKVELQEVSNTNVNEEISIEQIKGQVTELLKQLDENIQVKKGNLLISLFFPEENDRNEYYSHTNHIYEIGQKLLSEEKPEHYIDLTKNLSALARIFKFKTESISSEKIADRKQQREFLYNAAVMYKAAIVIAEKEGFNSQDITDIIKEYESLETFLLSNIIGVEKKLIINRNYKEKLDEIDSEARKLFDEIDANPELVANKEGYLERASLINNFYKQISINLKSILKDMWEDSIKQMNALAPKHAVISFGSLAKGTATHYSDIEFGVLIQNEKDKEYFHNVATLMALKVISIGQTSVPRELLKNEDGLWMNLDKLIIPGFQFDLGGKTPLNRKRLEDYVDDLTGRIIYPAGEDKYDLVATPQEMSKYIRDDYFNVDKLLPIELVNFECLYGEDDLVEEYKIAIWNYLSEKIQDGSSRYENRAIQILAENFGNKLSDLETYKPQLGAAYEGILLNVKQDIYRLPESLIEGIRVFYGSKYNTPIEFLDSMDSENTENKIFSQQAQENLKIMYAIATEFRLRIYVDGKGQTDSFITLHTENNKREYYTSIYESDKYGIISSYYYIALSFHEILSQWKQLGSNQEKKDLIENALFWDDSPFTKGQIARRFTNYNEAKEFFEQELSKSPNNIKAKVWLGYVYSKLSNFLKLAQLFPNDIDDISSDEDARIAIYLAYAHKYDISPERTTILTAKSLAYYKANIDLYMLGETQNNMGMVKYKLQHNAIEAMQYFMESAKTRIEHFRTIHPKIGNSLANIANIYSELLNEHKEAIKLFDKVYTYYKLAYGSDYNRDIAMLFNDEAWAYKDNNELEEARNFFKKALSIYKQIYKTPHAETAACYYNLGGLDFSLGNGEEARMYLQLSVDIYQEVYKNMAPSRDMLEARNLLEKIKIEQNSNANIIQNQMDIENIKLELSKLDEHEKILISLKAESSELLEDCYKIETFYKNLLHGLVIYDPMNEIENKPEALAKIFYQLGQLYLIKGVYYKNAKYINEASLYSNFALSIIDKEEILLSRKVKFKKMSQTELERHLENFNNIATKSVALLEELQTALRRTLDVPEQPQTSNNKVIEKFNEDRSFFKELRVHCDKKLKEIDEGYCSKDTEIGTKEAEKYEIKEIRALYEYITKEMKSYLAKKTEYAASILGPHSNKCEYAVIGLGSISLKQITPYSDLEFAILIDDEYEKVKEQHKNEDETIQIDNLSEVEQAQLIARRESELSAALEHNKQNKEYFRKLTELVYFEIVNLRESTISRSKFGISFMEFGIRGISFDLGGKTPLGRPDKPYYELIQTPYKMAEYLNTDKLYTKYEKYLQNTGSKTVAMDKLLPFILEKSVYICGKGKLVEDFHGRVTQYLEIGMPAIQDNSLKYQARVEKVLLEGIAEFNYETLEVNSKSAIGDLQKFNPHIDGFAFLNRGMLYNVKNEIYRLPDRLLYDLSVYLGVIPDSAWNAVEVLYGASKNNNENALHHLYYAVSYAVSLRLRIYSTYGEQVDEATPIYSDAIHSNNIEPKFIFTNEELSENGKLFRYYYTTISLYTAIKEFLTSKDISILKDNEFYSNSKKNQGIIYNRILNTQKAQEKLSEALQENKNDLAIKHSLALIDFYSGRYQEAAKLFEELLNNGDYGYSGFGDQDIKDRNHLILKGNLFISKHFFDRNLDENREDLLKDIKRLLEIIDNISDEMKLVMLNILSNIIIYANEDKLFDKAKEYLVFSKDIFEHITEKLSTDQELIKQKINLYRNQCDTYIGTKEFEQARVSIIKCIKLMNDLYGDSYLLLYNDYERLAETYLQEVKLEADKQKDNLLHAQKYYSETLRILHLYCDNCHGFYYLEAKLQEIASRLEALGRSDSIIIEPTEISKPTITEETITNDLNYCMNLLQIEGQEFMALQSFTNKYIEYFKNNLDKKIYKKFFSQYIFALIYAFPKYNLPEKETEGIPAQARKGVNYFDFKLRIKEAEKYASQGNFEKALIHLHIGKLCLQQIELQDIQNQYLSGIEEAYIQYEIKALLGDSLTELEEIPSTFFSDRGLKFLKAAKAVLNEENFKQLLQRCKDKFITEQELFEVDSQEISTIINLLLDNQEATSSSSSSSTSSSQNQPISTDQILESIDNLKDFIGEKELSQNPGFYQYAFNALSNNRFADSAKQVIHLASNLREYLLHLLESDHIYQDLGMSNNDKATRIYELLDCLLEFMASGQRFIGFVPRYPDFDPDDYFGGGGDSNDGHEGNNNNEYQTEEPMMLPLGSISNTNSTDI